VYELLWRGTLCIIVEHDSGWVAQSEKALVRTSKHGTHNGMAWHGMFEGCIALNDSLEDNALFVCLGHFWRFFNWTLRPFPNVVLVVGL
jgi:hypothetical protein